MKVKELIEYGRKLLSDSDINDSEIISRKIAEYVLKLNRNEIITNLDNEITDKNKEDYDTLIFEVASGEPLQYITNNQEFYGIDFYVDENVLIPQPDTEILVEEVIEIVKNTGFSRVLDMCTGSGCIGISIAKNIESAKVLITDVSENALDIAKKNIEKINVKNINILQSDMFEEIEDEFDIIVSNPPYVETEEIGLLPSDVQKEPILALDGGEDGLEFYKELINESHKYLNDDGYLCMEIGYNQKDTVIELLEENSNYKNIYSKKDLSGNDRIIVAQRR